MLAEVGLGLSVVLAGLWSGLLLAVATLLHPMYAALDGREFAVELQRFLPVARKSPTNWVSVIGLIVFPVLALVALAGDPTGAPFVLTALGLVCTVAGPLLVSRLLAEPNYAVILGWDPATMPVGWEAVRRRYFLWNWVRGAFTWVAFGLFLAAAYAHLSR
ncbi:hypothetical protein [Pseudonocardia sp.]|uniref:hypothetical protein n=1 Tax=Pseudonocardia sp. TaxID=60912 RepID=UPI003D0AC063